MKIKFLEDRTVEAQGFVEQEFKAGEVYELSASSARRWLRRNVAEEVQGAVKRKKVAEKPAPTKSKGRSEKVLPKSSLRKGPEVKEEGDDDKADTEAASK